MKILYARFAKNTARLDIGLGEFSTWGRFHHFVSDTMFDDKAEQSADRIVNIDDSVDHGIAFIVTDDKQLKSYQEKIQEHFADYYQLSDADRDLIGDYARFIKTAEVRATSLDKKELYDHGAFTIVGHNDYPYHLYINNWYVGEFENKLYHEGPSEAMNDDGDHIDYSTGKPVTPVKPDGEKMGDELVFIASAQGGPYYLDDMDFDVFEPDEALALFVGNKPPYHEHQIETEHDYLGEHNRQITKPAPGREQE